MTLLALLGWLAWYIGAGVVMTFAAWTIVPANGVAPMIARAWAIVAWPYLVARYLAWLGRGAPEGEDELFTNR